MSMIYTWMGDVKLFVPGVGTVPPHSTFEMRKDSLKLAGVAYLLKTRELRKGDTLQQLPPEPDEPIVDITKIDEPDQAVDSEGG